MEALHQAVEFKPKYTKGTDVVKVDQPFQKTDPSHAMASGMAHLFNHHFVGILLNMEMAMDKLPKDGKPFRLLTEAMKSACQAAEICRWLMGSMGFCLGYSASGQAPLDISGACLRFLPVFRAMVPPNTRMETDLPRCGPSVRISPDLLQQVLVNLIKGAGEFFGGAPAALYFRAGTVGTETLPEQDFFSRVAGPAYACVEIESRGCPPADRGGSAVFRTLSTAEAILSVYGGYAAAENKEPGKLTFKIFLPACGAEPFPAGTKVVSGSISELFS